MGRKNQSIGYSQGTPLQVTTNHPRPSDSICKCTGNPKKLFGKKTILIWPCNNKVIIRSRQFFECLEKKIDAFLAMDTTQEKQRSLVSQAWEFLMKSICLSIHIWRRFADTQTRHDLVATIRAKSSAGQSTLLVCSKTHRFGAPQDSILAEPPEQHFLKVFYGILALEPRIEHSMRIDEVRLACTASGLTNSYTWVLP